MTTRKTTSDTDPCRENRRVTSVRISAEVSRYLQETGQGLTGICERLILRSAEFKRWKKGKS